MAGVRLDLSSFLSLIFQGKIIKKVKPVLHVWPQLAERKNNTVKVSARLVMGEATHELWYTLPTSYESILPTNSDNFLIAVVLMAMRHSSEIQLHGSVSASLLSNIDEFQAAWSCWLEDLHVVPIYVDRELNEVFDQLEAAAVATFTGGLDSSYTVYRHAKNLVGRRTQPLRSGVFVHGFDIPLTEQDGYGRAFKKAEIMLNSIDLSIIPMATNFRDIMDPYLGWINTCGVALGSCLLLLQNKFSSALVASSYNYQMLTFPNGSNAITDSMMGNNQISIIHDGSEDNRTGKSRLIADWPEAMQHLRVCWQGKYKDINCCECEKCIRNILTFRITQKSLPNCFQKDVSDKMLERISLQVGGPLDSFKSLYYSAAQSNIKDAWVEILRKK